MYSYNVTKLRFTNEDDEDNDVEEKNDDGDNDGDLSSQVIRELILKELLKERDTPERQYLMQCAVWQESEWTKGEWVAFSPIYNSYTGGKWPIYDINLYFSEKSDNKFIEFHSWKGDYEPETYSTTSLYGNLPYKGTYRLLHGTVWTRG